MRYTMFMVAGAFWCIAILGEASSSGGSATGDGTAEGHALRTEHVQTEGKDDAAKQEKREPDGQLAAVSSLADEHTLGFICFNFQKLDLRAMAAKLGELRGKDFELKDIAEMEKLFQPAQEVVKAGARRMYLMLRSDTGGMAILALFPLEPDADADRVLAAVERFEGKASGKAAEKIGKVIVSGDEKSRQAVRAIKPKDRPDIVQALGTSGDSFLQMLLLPSGDFREALGPSLGLDPKGDLGKPLKVFLEGARWASLSLDLVPKARFQCVIQGKDAAAATELEAVFADLLGKLGSIKMGPGMFGIDPAKVAKQWLTPKRVGNQLVVSLEEPRLIVLMRAVAEEMRASAPRIKSRNNLVEIALAMNNHHDLYKYYPLHAIYSKDGKTPLLSWRVAILPYLEQSQLYNEFKLDEPWDSPHNIKLVPRMPRIYAFPADDDKDAKDGKTYYQVFAGANTAFNGTERITSKKLAAGNGEARTIMVIEAREPVIWTKPADLTLPAAKDQMPPVGGLVKNGVNVVFFDASARFLRPDLPPAVLRALVTPFGGESVDLDKLEVTGKR
jgi:hypothetical protein